MWFSKNWSTSKLSNFSVKVFLVSQVLFFFSFLGQGIQLSRKASWRRRWQTNVSNNHLLKYSLKGYRILAATHVSFLKLVICIFIFNLSILLEISFACSFLFFFLYQLFFFFFFSPSIFSFYFCWFLSFGIFFLQFALDLFCSSFSSFLR